MRHTIALVGDYTATVVAHQAIPRALELARDELRAELDWQWIHTRELRNATQELKAFSALWVVPASPYANMSGALEAIRWARENRRPFLGTCGGFQHALIEFARNVLAIDGADHAETSRSATELVVTPLACALVEQSDELRFSPGSRLRAVYGRDTAIEGFHCSYGPAAAYRARFEQAGLRFTAFDAAGAPRAAELPESLHPFFIGTLFQPERAALRGETPPLARALVRAIVTTVSANS